VGHENTKLVFRTLFYTNYTNFARDTVKPLKSLRPRLKDKKTNCTVLKHEQVSRKVERHQTKTINLMPFISVRASADPETDDYLF
jgi:hypothetical protein